MATLMTGFESSRLAQFNADKLAAIGLTVGDVRFDGVLYYFQVSN